MKCPYCGSDLSERSAVCLVCIGQQPSDTPEVATARRVRALRLRRNRWIAFAWIAIPMLILAACVCAYVTSFFSLMSAVQAAGGSAVHAAQHIEVFKFVRIVLGCVSVLGMLGIIAGIPLGIWYLSKDEDIPGVVYDERSGHGTASVVPPELRRWSWGAAGLTWIWGARHRVWIALVALVPGISIFIMILLGLRGNEYAWRAKKYESVDDLLHQEEVWKLWGIVFFIFHVLGILWLRYTTA